MSIRPNSQIVFGLILAVVLCPAIPGIAQEDVADVKSQDLRVAGNEHQRYFLIGPKETGTSPMGGYRLLLVLPGGDGGADFHAFVKRIFKNALPDNYVVAQPVSVEWTPGQFKKLVWPTAKSECSGMEFTTEQFAKAVIEDVKKKYKINPDYVFLLGWSSGGTACYSIALQEQTQTTGAFIAMSVFKPANYPSLKNAEGRAFYILHSPEDFIPIKMAETAEKRLSEKGAAAELARYSGGHGWRGDVYGNIRKGIEWLEQHHRQAKPPSEKPGVPG